MVDGCVSPAIPSWADASFSVNSGSINQPSLQSIPGTRLTHASLSMQRSPSQPVCAAATKAAVSGAGPIAPKPAGAGQFRSVTPVRASPQLIKFTGPGVETVNTSATPSTAASSGSAPMGIGSSGRASVSVPGPLLPPGGASVAVAAGTMQQAAAYRRQKTSMLSTPLQWQGHLAWSQAQLQHQHRSSLSQQPSSKGRCLHHPRPQQPWRGAAAAAAAAAAASAATRMASPVRARIIKPPPTDLPGVASVSVAPPPNSMPKLQPCMVVSQPPVTTTAPNPVETTASIAPSQFVSRFAAGLAHTPSTPFSCPSVCTSAPPVRVATAVPLRPQGSLTHNVSVNRPGASVAVFEAGDTGIQATHGSISANAGRDAGSTTCPLGGDVPRVIVPPSHSGIRWATPCARAERDPASAQGLSIFGTEATAPRVIPPSHCAGSVRLAPHTAATPTAGIGSFGSVCISAGSCAVPQDPMSVPPAGASIMVPTPSMVSTGSTTPCMPMAAKSLLAATTSTTAPTSGCPSGRTSVGGMSYGTATPSAGGCTTFQYTAPQPAVLPTASVGTSAPAVMTREPAAVPPTTSVAATAAAAFASAQATRTGAPRASVYAATAVPQYVAPSGASVVMYPPGSAPPAAAVSPVKPTLVARERKVVPPWAEPARQLERRQALGLQEFAVQEFANRCEFVSLGSYCGVAFGLQVLGLTKFSYPLDWARSPADGVAQLFRTRFAEFTTFGLFADKGEHGKLYGKTRWGGSFWHHDPTDPRVQQDFTRRVGRLLGPSAEVPASKPRVFVRATNSTAELMETEKLYNSLSSSLPEAEVYILIIIDMQLREGLYSIPSIGNGQVLFYRIHERIWEDRNAHWRDQMHKNMEAYADAIGAAVRWWAGRADISSLASPEGSVRTLAPEDHSKEVIVLDSISDLQALCEPFDGGDAARELFTPKSIPSNPPLQKQPPAQPQASQDPATPRTEACTQTDVQAAAAAVDLSSSQSSVQTMVDTPRLSHHPGATPEDTVASPDKEISLTDPEAVAGDEVKENQPCMSSTQQPQTSQQLD
eukprot:CAMPEP_0178452328 /NCGR_PEP_ID=MMETSP0689_2-20121128/44186_1 /TAXON_ID=160604 /ORGANISM="Amphidinium massartii, Strain CS-259" /LENGTH=1047 /DNA_ID=CAMNT_0020078027 /DNA_START=44 /DNA_END=3185 /DNA_ORIENTATION=+